ncbi:MAG: GDSL-type esterase/lipase family protein [Thermodesulfobacteriota bacterium]|nr:GDSL-type esterase/lipase family protein [Thermodesulfobacteriota bacterium]
MEQKIKPVNTINKLLSGVPVVIVALGDSLTYGWMVDKGYLDFLKEMIGKRFPAAIFSLINCGMPAATASDGLYRLHRDVLSHNPDCVFVQFGINDAFSGYTPEEFRDSIEKIVTGIRENLVSDIILVTSVCLENSNDNTRVRRYYGQLEQLADQYRLPLSRVHEYWEDRMSGGIRFSDLVQGDRVHPVSRGYRFMAEAIMELFS